jgi:hypothetical protein
MVTRSAAQRRVDGIDHQVEEGVFEQDAIAGAR